MTLCTFAPSGPDCLEAGQSPPDDGNITGRSQHSYSEASSAKTSWYGEETRTIVSWKVNTTNLCQAGDSSYLRVEVGAVWELVHHDGAGVVQQRLLVNGVLYLWDFLQVAQLKAFGLETHVFHSEQTEVRDQEPL